MWSGDHLEKVTPSFSFCPHHIFLSVLFTFFHLLLSPTHAFPRHTPTTRHQYILLLTSHPTPPPPVLKRALRPVEHAIPLKNSFLEDLPAASNSPIALVFPLSFFFSKPPNQKPLVQSNQQSKTAPHIPQLPRNIK